MTLARGRVVCEVERNKRRANLLGRRPRDEERLASDRSVDSELLEAASNRGSQVRLGFGVREHQDDRRRTQWLRLHFGALYGPRENSSNGRTRAHAHSEQRAHQDQSSARSNACQCDHELAQRVQYMDATLLQESEHVRLEQQL